MFRTPSLAAARDAVLARLPARPGPQRPWRRWLLRVVASPSSFRRRVFHLARRSAELVLYFWRGPCIPGRSPPPSDPAALRCGVASPPLLVRVSLHGVVFAALVLGAAGTIVLHVLIASGAITTHQEYFGLISFCFTELRDFLAAAGQAWDVYSGLLWLWEDMKLQRREQQLQRREQQLQPWAAELVISAPPPAELDMC